MPFQFEAYRPDNGSILDLMMAGPRARAAAARTAGEAQARAAEMRGQNTAHLAGSLGQIAQGVTGQVLQYQADAPQREMQRMQVEDAKSQRQRDQMLRETIPLVISGDVREDALLQIAGPESGMRLIQGLRALQGDPVKSHEEASKALRDTMAGMDDVSEELRAEWYPGVRARLIQRRVIRPEDAPEQYDPNFYKMARNYGREPQKPADGFTLSEGSTRFDANGKPLASVPKPTPEAKTYPVETFDAKGRPIRKLATEEELRAGVPVYQAPKSADSQRFWVMRDGKPLRVTEGEYRPGDLPANTREQGRPVTSGDAGRVADYDTSLDDVAVLARTVAPKIDAKGNVVSSPTGTRAAIGASLPKMVTDLTGWGTEAKQKQAVIDRVKQVIGKALEGGVLRKEDEYKYEKILPTIGDTAELVASKLKGLDSAIRQRRQTHLDALEDAGYEVTRFRARAPHGGNTDGSGAVTVQTPDGQTFTFPSKAQADAFKLRAGIK